MKYNQEEYEKRLRHGKVMTSDKIKKLTEKKFGKPYQILSEGGSYGGVRNIKEGS